MNLSPSATAPGRNVYANHRHGEALTDHDNVSRQAPRAAPPFRRALQRQLTEWAVGESRMGRPRRLLRVWPWWEKLARRLWPVVQVPGSQYGLMGIHFARYKGVTFELPDGTRVTDGDPVGEIHLNNSAFVRALGTRVGSDKFLALTMFRDGLHALAKWTRQPGFPRPVKAICGVSVLSRGAVRLGFTPRTRPPTLQTWMDRVFLDGLLALYTAEGAVRLSADRTAMDEPHAVWMSVAELHRRYLGG